MHRKNNRLPYDSPCTLAFSLLQEQQIMSGSTEETLTDLGAIDILNEPFFTSIL